MNIDELIKVLQGIKKEHGSLEVCVCTSDDGGFAAPSSYAEVVYYSDQGGEYELIVDPEDEDPDGKAVFINF